MVLNPNLVSKTHQRFLFLTQRQEHQKASTFTITVSKRFSKSKPLGKTQTGDYSLLNGLQPACQKLIDTAFSAVQH